MSKKRSGAQVAGMTMVALDDVRTWEKVEDRCRDVVETIPDLQTHERNLEELGKTKDCFTKADLDKVVLWKHTVGKNRIYNIKYLQSNSEQSVKENSRTAISLALSINADDCLEEDGSLSAAGKKSIQEAIAALGKLKGVGPATASAVLTLVRPDLFCYLYDEVIDVFEPQRDYKISNYLRVNSRCLQIARKLGGDWTPNRVARTIWTAARYLAWHGEELILNEGDEGVQDEEEMGDEEEEEEEEEGDEDEEDEEEEEEEEEPDEVQEKKPASKRQRKA